MQISCSSYAITGLGFIPPWAVNAGIIVGETKTLIVDTGANWLAAQTIHGYATAIRPENELVVFNCEPHFDHIGGNSYFADLGVEIFGHPEIQRTAEQFAAEKEDFNASITHPIRSAARETEAFFMNTNVVNPTHAAMAGHIFELGDVKAEVLSTPGHTSINQAIYNRTDNILFCADCIVTDYIPNMEASDTNDWHSWLSSLKLIEALAPDVVVPGHGQVMRGKEIFVQIEQTRKFVERALEEGKAPTT